MEVDGTRGIRISVKQISEAPDWLKSFCVCLGHKICFIVCLYICLEYISETFLAYVLKELFFFKYKYIYNANMPSKITNIKI